MIRNCEQWVTAVFVGQENVTVQLDQILISLSFVTATGVSAVLALYAYSRRERVGARELCVCMLAVTVCSLGYAFETASSTPTQVELCLHIEYLGLAFLPFLWIVLVSRYTGYIARLHTLALKGLLAAGVLTVLAHATDGFHHLFYQQIVVHGEGTFPLVSLIGGVGFWCYAAYLLASLLAGSWLLYRCWRSAPAGKRFGQRSLLLLSLLPPVLYALYLSGIMAVNAAPMALALFGLTFAWLVVRRPAPNLAAAVYSRLLNTLQEGILVLDGDNTVVRYNPALPQLLEEIHAAAIGLSAEAVLSNRPLLLSQLANTLERVDIVQKGNGKRRCLESRLLLLTDAQEEVIGKMLLISDVTRYKQSQSHMIRAEKMTVLGKLVTNVTKELHDPLQSIKETSTEIESWFVVFAKQITDLFASIDSEQKQLLFELIEKVKDAPQLTTREEQKRLLQILPLLWENGLEDTNKVARYLVKLNRGSDLEAFLPIVKNDNAAAILEFVLEIAVQRKNLQGILRAVDRTDRLVTALKKYSRNHLENKPALLDIQLEIENVLQLYGYLLRSGVEIITDFRPTPKIMGNANELQQVWTSLLQNALQAVRGKGRVVIVTEETGDELIVRFIDNGSALTPDSIPKLFDPYHSSALADNAEGFGLPLCKEIVERHRGRIEAASLYGENRFSVYLPLIIH